MTDHDQTELIGRDELDHGGQDEDRLNAAVEWTGLPAFEPLAERRIQLILSFETEEEREALKEQLGLVIQKKTKKTWSAWWPPRELEDLAALRFDFGGDS